jgi:hypothetical protein
MSENGARKVRECEQRYLGEQWCVGCVRPCRRVGVGGLCPHCDEPVAIWSRRPSTQLAERGDYHHAGPLKRYPGGRSG